MIAERLDHDAAKERLPLHDQTFHRLAHFRVVGMRRERARQRRPDELRRLDLEGVEQARDDRLVRRALEVRVRDGPHAVVLVGDRREHHVARARVVEAREDHERAKPHVLVGVLLDGGEQGRHRHRGVGPPDGPGGRGSNRKIQVAQPVDCRAHLLGRDRRLSVGGRRLLDGSGGLRGQRDRGERSETADRTAQQQTAHGWAVARSSLVTQGGVVRGGGCSSRRS